MSNLSAPRPIQRGDGIIRPYKASAADIFAGAIVSIDGTTRFAKNAGDTANDKFVGIADKSCKNSTGAAGAKTVRVIARGVVNLFCTGASQTWVGKKVYAVDNQTVALTSTNSVLVGTVTEVVSATAVFVSLTPDA